MKLKYGDATCVPYERPHFLPLGRSNIQTMEINIRSDTDDLGLFESRKLIVTLTHWIPTFKGGARQHAYGIGNIFKGLTRTFAPVVNKGLFHLGKQVIESGVQILDDISRGEDVKVTIKRRTIEGAKKMGKKSINRPPARKTVSRKQTFTGTRHTANKMKRVSTKIL